jgi:cobalt-zinc-cadmium resistance protein CzcA
MALPVRPQEGAGLVDGAVVIVENILRHIESHVDEHRTLMQVIGDAAHEVQRPVFFAILGIITAYLPIFTLQRRATAK